MSSITRKLAKTGIATLVAATAMTGLTVLPAHADASGIAATANGEVNNGPCAHGGYVPGDGSSNSCGSGGGSAEAWCADFAGWVWARNGVAHLGDLSPSAASFFDYGRRYGTLHNTPQVGDAVVFNYNYGTDRADHVALVVAVGGGSVTFVGGNEGHSSGHRSGIVQQDTPPRWGVGQAPYGQTISGYISPVFTNTPAANPNPSTLPTGTLVKSPNGPGVKVIISGSGVPIAGSDVAPDGYDLSRIVQVDDAAFNALPTSPPTGTVVHDMAGGAARYVVVNGVALPISGADWTSGGYSTRQDMGVPSSWLQGAVQGTLPSGWVVMDQSGTDASRYVMVNGSALPISGSEWTADHYDQRMLMGVPGDWLRAAAARPLPNGTVLMDQNGTDPSRYVIAGGAAAAIAGSEWSAEGYSNQPAVGVPGAWLGRAAAATPAEGTLIKGQAGTDPSVYVVARNTALPLTNAEFSGPYAGRDIVAVPETWEGKLTARPLANGTVVKNVSGADPSVYVMAGGMAVPLSGADYTGLGYDKRPLLGVPGAWEASAAAKAAPGDGTLLLSPDSSTVWQVVGGGSKKALTASDFGPGKLDLNDVVSVPTALTAKLPTVTQ
ncbi:CHAP domain-containing protein [Kitasatospora sp. NPDC096128]|uniref:CHAP domain-containing protein n=1 Tax=Kitasatospora sp. NPDC096128 TaxID=3155547 RepID=UPI00332A893C